MRHTTDSAEIEPVLPSFRDLVTLCARKGVETDEPYLTAANYLRAGMERFRGGAASFDLAAHAGAVPRPSALANNNPSAQQFIKRPIELAVDCPAPPLLYCPQHFVNVLVEKWDHEPIARLRDVPASRDERIAVSARAGN